MVRLHGEAARAGHVSEGRAGSPVRIAELQRWVCQAAGDAGWLPMEAARNNHRIAVVGGGPSGLSCAYYLAVMGCSAHVYDRAAKPGGKLIQAYSPEELPLAAVERDLKGVLMLGIHFFGGRELGSTLELQELVRSYDAVYLATGFTDTLSGYIASALGHDWLRGVDRCTQQVGGRPGVCAGGGLVQRGQTVVEAAADGRRAAVTSCSQNCRVIWIWSECCAVCSVACSMAQATLPEQTPRCALRVTSLCTDLGLWPRIIRYYSLSRQPIRRSELLLVPSRSLRR